MTRHPSRDWSAKGEPFSRPEDDEADAIEARAMAILDRLDPHTADVLRVQGRHVSDRRAAEMQHRLDMVDASHEISAARDWSAAAGAPTYAELERRRYPWLDEDERPGRADDAQEYTR